MTIPARTESTDGSGPGRHRFRPFMNHHQHHPNGQDSRSGGDGSPSSKHAVVIGAGTGGIAIAALLAKQGFRVSVFEKNPYHGGRCSLIHQNGFRWDQGPSLYLMPQCFQRVFDSLDEPMGYELLPCDPNYVLHFHDGTHLELSSNLATLKRNLEAIEPGSFPNLLEFIRESHAHMEASLESVLYTNFDTFWSFFTVRNLPLLWGLHMFESMYQRIGRFFKTDKLRKAFTFQSMYMGQSPFDAPATYSLLQFTELAEGIWYPRGGFNVVLQRLESIAESYGAEFHYGHPVSHITIDPITNNATGITLNNDRHIPADLVVCTADLVYAYNHLLPPSRYSRSLRGKQHTSSSISFYWGLSDKVPQLKAHNVFLAEAYKASFDRIFKDGTIPSEPSFYMHVPSRMDPSAAPPGKDCVTVLVPCGAPLHDLPPPKMETVVKHVRTQVISAIERATCLKGLDAMIETEVINTPQTWADKFNVWKGSILGLSHNVLQVCWFRPATRHGKHPNVFFVGASTHPGTGVPIVLCGALNVSQQISTLVSQGTLHTHDSLLRQLYLFLIALFWGYLHVMTAPLRVLGVVKGGRQGRGVLGGGGGKGKDGGYGAGVGSGKKVKAG